MFYFAFRQANAGNFQLNSGMVPKRTSISPTRPSARDLNFGTLSNPPRPPGSQGPPSQINPPSKGLSSGDLNFGILSKSPRLLGSQRPRPQINLPPPEDLSSFSRDLKFETLSNPPRPVG